MPICPFIWLAAYPLGFLAVSYHRLTVAIRSILSSGVTSHSFFGVPVSVFG